jgi:hypothetical protein
MAIRINGDIDARPQVNLGGFNTLGYNMRSFLKPPPNLVYQFVTNAPGTDRANISTVAGGLAYFNTFADDFWNGSRVQIGILTNGVRSTVEATVTDSKVNLAGNVTPTTGTPAVAGKITATTFEWRVESFMRPSAGYWFRVAAVDGSGNVGAYSGWVEFTAPASGLGVGTVSNTVAARVGTSTSGLSAPTNVAVAAKSGSPAIAQVTWDAVGSATGYLVDLSYQDPALNVTQQYLDLDTSGVSIPAGAVVWVQKEILTPPTQLATRVWNDLSTLVQWEPINAVYRFTAADFIAGDYSQYIAHGTRPSGIDSTHFFRARRDASSSRVLRQFFHAAANRGWSQLLPGEDYTLRYTLRAPSNMTATLTVGAVTTGGSTTFNLTTDWQTFTHTVSRDTLLASSDATVYSADLTIPTDTYIDIAECAFFRADLAPEDVNDRAKPDVVSGALLRETSMRYTSDDVSSIWQMCGRAGQHGRGSIQATLECARINNCTPWLMVNMCLFDSELPNLVAYLAAPANSGHPYADLRVSQGRSAPWIDAFDEIIIEFGNEPWGNLFTPTANHRYTDQGTTATLTGAETYGVHAQSAITAMKTSPYWSALEPKLSPMASGRAADNNAFGLTVIGRMPDATYTSTADYIGGWETASAIPKEDGASFIQTLRDDAVFSVNLAYVTGARAAGLEVVTYEGGPGFSLNGLNGAVVTAADDVVQEVVLKSRAGGVASFAVWCQKAAAGYAHQSFYRVADGDKWTSRALAGEGGPSMAWMLVKLVHDALGPCRAERLQITTSVPTAGSIDLIEAYRFKSGSTAIIAVFNREIDVSLLETDDPLYNATPSGKHAVTVRTNINSCTGMEYYANVGNFREHNRYTPGKRLNSSTKLQTVDDALCVEFTYDWTVGTPPADPFLLTIDDEFGAESDGLRAGNCVLIKLTGCT